MLGINVIGYHIGKIIMMKIINEDTIDDDCNIMIIGMYCDELTMDDDCI